MSWAAVASSDTASMRLPSDRAGQDEVQQQGDGEADDAGQHARPVEAHAAQHEGAADQRVGQCPEIGAEDTRTRQ